MIWDRDDDIFEDYYKNELNTLDHYDNMPLNVSDPAIYDGPPRLVVLLNHKPTEEPEKTSFEKVNIEAVNQVLEWVSNRLEKGLGDIWSQDPNTKKDNYGTNEAEFPGSDPEEQWARQVTEMFFGVRYGGPGPLQAPMDPFGFVKGSKNNSQNFWEAKMFRKISETIYPWDDSLKKHDTFLEPVENDDPAYSTVAACQQLATYGILTRGFNLDKDMNGLPIGCGKFDAYPLFKQGGTMSHSDEKTSIHSYLKASQAISAGITPGSLYSFNHDITGRTQNDGSHVVFTLRVNSKLNRFQFLDTSSYYLGRGIESLKSSPPKEWYFSSVCQNSLGSNYIGDGNDTGSYNEPYSKKLGKSIPVLGFAIPPPPSNLSKTVNFLKKARPVGLARLVITKRASGKESEKLLYVSKLLRMYRNDPNQNYSIARYFWSLRNLPGYETITAWWIIYHPKKQLAYTMWFDPKGRQLTLSDIQRYFDQSHPDKKWSIEKMLQPALIICSSWDEVKNQLKGGQAQFWKRWHSIDGEKGAALPKCITDANINSQILWHSSYLSNEFPKDENVTVPCVEGDDICSNDILNKIKVIHLPEEKPNEPDYFRDEDYVSKKEVKS